MGSRMRSAKAGFVVLTLGLMVTVLVPVAAAQAGTGFLQICKQVEPAGISTPFQFDIAGPGIVAQVSVAPGTCSEPLAAGPGDVLIEEFYPVAVFNPPSVRVEPPDRQITEPFRGRVTVSVPSGDVSNRTVVTFTNRLRSSILGVCKVAGEGVAVGTIFSFTINSETVSGTLTVPAGTTDARSCLFHPPIPVGEQITVSEVVPANSRVSSITVEPPERVVAGPDLKSATVTVTGLFPGTIVTFTNTAGPPPECKPGHGYGDKNHCHSGPPGTRR